MLSVWTWMMVCALAFTGTGAQSPSSHVFGKYYSIESGQKSQLSQTFFLFTPPGIDVAAGQTAPIMVYFHGGGFTGGAPSPTVTPEIQAYLSNGFFYASMGYRLVATKYYYESPNGTQLEEEFLHVNSTGHIWPDTAGMVMSDYKIRVGRQELNTKCSYDAVQGFEALLQLAGTVGIDVHSVGFSGGSAGGGEINYLTWVYHGFHPDRYSPRSMVYTMAQLDYPVQNILDKVWSLWATDVGGNTRLATILEQSTANCQMIIGNPWCYSNPENEVNLCNQTWSDKQLARFCGGEYDNVTIDELVAGTRWDAATEHERGLEVLWYTSVNMQRHAPRPFALFVANELNSTEGMNVVHNALYARLYGKFAALAGVNYTVYYTDYAGMPPQDAGTKRFADPTTGTLWNYRSSIEGYLDLPGIASTARASTAESILFACYAHGVRCTVLPPSPVPNGNLTAECKAEVGKDCGRCSGEASCCGACVRAHAQDLIAAGCPSAAAGGYHSCVAFCITLQI